MISQLKTTFFHYLYKRNSKGEAPIYCRLSLRDDKQQFSTGMNLLPELWDKDSQRAIGVTDTASLLNRKLQEIHSQLIRIEKQLYDEGEQITLQSIYNRYKGKSTEHTLCGVFEERIAKMRALIGVEYTKSTFQKFNEVYTHAKAFMTSEGMGDIPLKHLNYHFIKSYEEYLLCRKLRPITINKIIQRLREMILYSVRCGYILKDPFIEYKPLKERKQLVFLTREELDKLENKHFAQERLEQAKNIYLFSVYTGLAYVDAQELQPQDIIKGFDGKNWIHIKRKKTDSEVNIPLLPQAEAILEVFANFQNHMEYILPRISNQKINSFLKEIASIVGIDKKLTHHTARKTFASTILLYNDVPIEVVSMLLGHSDIKVTQKSYAQVVNKNISNHMNKLAEKLK